MEDTTHTEQSQEQATLSTKVVDGSAPPSAELTLARTGSATPPVQRPIMIPDGLGGEVPIGEASSTQIVAHIEAGEAPHVTPTTVNVSKIHAAGLMSLVHDVEGGVKDAGLFLASACRSLFHHVN
jgi:hypothetical protein